MADITGPEQLLDRLQDLCGDSIRAVATYDRDGYTVHYATEEIIREYSEEDIDVIYDDVILEDVEQPLQEQLFDDMGTVEGKIKIFQDGTVAHFWPTEQKEGVFISFTANADPGVRSLLSIAQAYYN
jgi:hypothetical protein